MRFIVEKALAGVLAQFPTAFTRASAAQNTAYRAPLRPAVTAQLRVSREIGSGRITCNAIKGGFAAVLFLELRDVPTYPEGRPEFGREFLRCDRMCV